jgi:hypothetical protein
VFQNGVLKRNLGLRGRKWREAGEDCIMRSFITCMLQVLSGWSRRMSWVGHVARIGEMRNTYKISVGKPERNRPIGRSKRRWEDNIRMDLREIGWVWTGCIWLRAGISGGLL